ncbi:hypothetical protein J4558_26920 [Leptolyngbya sp. 15MV]|nr:hypothetical protein J4558_26920 [Leptolyngbya sp. 15MV]
MMRMLEAGGIPPLTDGQRRADPDNPLGYYELEAVKRTRLDAGWLASAGGKAVKVIHLLLLDLPATYQYRVVFMQRAMEEVIASQQRMLERAGRGGGRISAEALARQYEAQLRQVDAFIAARPNFSRKWRLTACIGSAAGRSSIAG